MKNQKQQFNEEELKHEPPVTANNLLAEIKPLLEDYFIGEITLDGDSLTYSLPNGQKFIIKAELTA